MKELAKDSMAAANNRWIYLCVLDISKIEAGKREIVTVPFDPRMLFNHLSDVRAIVREKGLRLMSARAYA